jgi:hypothetical protein
MTFARLRLLLFLIVLFALSLTLSQAPVQAGGLTVTPTDGVLGTTFQFDGTGFAGNELVSLWVNWPDGSVHGQGFAHADSSGAASFTVTPTSGMPFGNYVQVAQGLNSHYEVTAAFTLDSPVAIASGGAGGGGGAGGCAGNFSAGGFVPGEIASTWTTRPDSVSLALPNAAADPSGVVTFAFFPQPGWPVGPYIVVAQGRTSHYTGVNNFNWDGANLTGGAACDSGGAAAYVPPAVAITPGSIVNPQGPAVYLGSDPTALYYSACSWKWVPFIGGSTLYYIVVGFSPGESVSWFAQDFLTGAINATGSGTAGDAGNYSTSISTAGWPIHHVHVWFKGASSGHEYCGHYDLMPQP